ncbi:hypothetical protein GCM10027570_06930 [Streptomonospora sediminis]
MLLTSSSFRKLSVISGFVIRWLAKMPGGAAGGPEPFATSAAGQWTGISSTTTTGTTGIRDRVPRPGRLVIGWTSPRTWRLNGPTAAAYPVMEIGDAQPVPLAFRIVHGLGDTPNPPAWGARSARMESWAEMKATDPASFEDAVAFGGRGDTALSIAGMSRPVPNHQLVQDDEPLHIEETQCQ